MPVIVPAATPAVTLTQEPAAPENSVSIQAALKLLQEMKAANE